MLINGVVKRSDGETIVWVNGKPVVTHLKPDVVERSADRGERLVQPAIADVDLLQAAVTAFAFAAATFFSVLLLFSFGTPLMPVDRHVERGRAHQPAHEGVRPDVPISKRTTRRPGCDARS